MLKLKLQYFSHLRWRVDSFKKTLMLGKIKGKRRRGQQRMRCLDSITDSIDVRWSGSHSVVSNSLRPHGLYSPWNSPGQSTRVGSLSLLQGIFPTQGSNPALRHCRQILYQLSYKGSPSRRESEPNPEDSERQGSLVCCCPWSHRVRNDWVAEQQQQGCSWPPAPNPFHKHYVFFRTWPDVILPRKLLGSYSFILNLQAALLLQHASFCLSSYLFTWPRPASKHVGS